MHPPVCTRFFAPSHPKSLHRVPSPCPSLGHLGALAAAAQRKVRCSCSRSGTQALTLRHRLSGPDNAQLISTATPPVKVAQHVLGHRLPGAIKITKAPQLLKDEFWKEMIDSHS